MNNSIEILSTRPYAAALIDEAAELGITIHELSFIATEPIDDLSILQEIQTTFTLQATVVFTSMNAVEAVADQLLGFKPEWKIYCIGSTTRQLVEKYFGTDSIAGTAASAVALAELIVNESPVKELIYFCGNKRRDELPQILQERGFEVDEIAVYQTTLVPRKITKDYHGIFFSPSAVESFFTLNKAASQTVFFAIGSTTAAAIRNYSDNKIITADTQSKEEMLEKVKEYFCG
jgi:uroporphyrinogen-III synthase